MGYGEVQEDGARRNRCTRIPNCTLFRSQYPTNHILSCSTPAQFEATLRESTRTIPLERIFPWRSLGISSKGKLNDVDLK